MHRLSDVTEPHPPITLSLWTENGERRDIVLPGPGGTVRFCIGAADGDHSATWRVWAGSTASDVYLAVRDIAGEQKFSLHESGDWRHQFASPELAEAYGFGSRIIDQWRQPPELGESRLTLGFSVRARLRDLAAYPDRGRPPKDVVWLPAAPEGMATIAHIVIGRLQELPFALSGRVPFAGFSLADGRAVLLVVGMEDIPPETNESLDSVIRSVSERAEVSTAAMPRMLIHGSNEHGRFAWDVALSPKVVRQQNDSGDVAPTERPGGPGDRAAGAG